MGTQQVQIKDFFSKVKKKQDSLLLSQTYQGFLFTQPVQFMDETAEEINLKASHQIFSLCQEKNAVLHSEKVPSKIIGDVRSFNPNSGEMILKNLSLKKDRWVTRREMRIQPHQPLMGILNVKGQNIRGCLENLSTEGAGFLLHISEYSEFEPKTGQSITLFFNLHKDIELNISGKITDIRPLSSKLLNLGLQLKTNNTDKMILKPYLDRSYNHMVHQMDAACRKLTEAMATKDLYF